MPPQVGQREVGDDTHYRTGFVLDEGMTQKMLAESMRAKETIAISQVDKKHMLDEEQLLEIVERIRGITMIAYPAYHGLGDWEPVRVLLENNEKFDETLHMSDDLRVETAQLWVCGKELQNGKMFSDYFGANEKSKFVVKVQGKGQGPPVREPLIDQESHKKMLAFYHKKQEEQKKMEEDNEDDYMNSAWANTS